MLPAETRIARVGLRAQDPEALAALYEDVLGLPRETRDGGLRFGGVLDVRPVEPGEPMPVDAHAPGLFHVALLYPTRGHLAAVLRTLAERHVRLTGASDHGVSEALYLRDPEGNGVELYWDRPREAWPTTPDGRITMFTERLDLDGLLAEPESEAAPAPAPVIGHAHLKVAQLERSTAFWREVVGMDLITTYGAQAAFLSAGGYHHHIGLNTWHSLGAAPAPPTTAGLDHVVLGLPDRAAVDALAERVERAGGTPELAPDGELAAADPDGLVLRATTA